MAEKIRVDLALVEQKGAVAPAFQIEVAALFVGSDMEVFQEDLAVLNGHEAIRKAHLAAAHALYLAADEDDACLVGFVDKIVVIGFFIGCDNFDPFHFPKKTGATLAPCTLLFVVHHAAVGLIIKKTTESTNITAPSIKVKRLRICSLLRPLFLP